MNKENRLSDDITITSNNILKLIKEFENRNGYSLEVFYENKKFITKLVSYIENE